MALETELAASAAKCALVSEEVKQLRGQVAAAEETVRTLQTQLADEQLAHTTSARALSDLRASTDAAAERTSVEVLRLTACTEELRRAQASETQRYVATCHRETCLYSHLCPSLS